MKLVNQEVELGDYPAHKACNDCIHMVEFVYNASSVLLAQIVYYDLHEEYTYLTYNYFQCIVNLYLHEMQNLKDLIKNLYFV